eukprot:10450046-Alexandrium_andersonii.AAC.1
MAKLDEPSAMGLSPPGSGPASGAGDVSRRTTLPGRRQSTPRRACAGLASRLPTAGYARSAQRSRCLRAA